MSAGGPHNPTTFVSAEVYLGPQVAPSSSQSGSSDMDIPRPAIEAAAKAACEATYPPSPNGRVKSHDPWEAIEEWEQDAWRATATAALKAAFPHLRPLFQQATQVGYELGRREAKIEHAGMLEARASGEGLSTATRGVLRGMASTIARDLTKGDPK